MVQSNVPAEIYQLHILLLQINPPIWRRLLVRSDSSIATLHDLLQIAFDWSDFHLLCATPLSNWNLTLSHLVAIGPAR